MNAPADPSSLPRRLSGPPAALALGYVVLCFLLDWLSYVHPMRGTQITAWQPQAALSVALLTRYPSAWWLVAGTLAGAAAARIGPAPPPWEAAAALAATLGVVLAAAALRRWFGPLPRIATRKAFLTFMLIAAAAAALDALLYVGTIAAAGFLDTDRLSLALLRRWTGEAVGLIISLPAVFLLADRTRRAQLAAMLRSVEWWLVAGTALVVAWMVFLRPAEEQFMVFYLLFLPVAWGAARFGHVGAVASAALVQGLLFAAVQSAAYQPITVFELHRLLTALGATGLLLGATVEEREQAEQALRASLHAAAAADMAAALAHELNQPLTALRTYARAAQLLSQRDAAAPAPAGTPSLADVSAKLVAEVNRAGDVIKRLRDFFRHRGTALQAAQIETIVAQVLGSQALHAQTAGVGLHSEIEASLPAVWIDAVQIEVVLRNLVANAIDAAAAGPAGADEPQVVVGAAVRGRQLVVDVRDTGAGLALDELPQVFESRPSSKPGGMGIGLVISRSIVEAHEGRLWAEAGPGGKFYFSLPLTEAEHG
ncbi:MASE1 domain-containing protein [Aquabacterium sp.]|uniref:MASE1 domain-containing protein n=1 Tax=Aquabacterium sp. TaxID=1872578 RepID=UPI003784B987